MFELSAIEYLFGLDLLVGSTKSPAEEFDYFMFQIFFRGSVTISWFELRGARVLFANNMQPKLGPVDREGQSLRYFNWYKSTNPINVPGDRRLAAWQARKGSWSLGIGVSASIAGIGKVLELGVFVLVVTWTFEINFGNLTPEQLATSVSPLRLASATQGLEGKSLPVHMERFDPNWDGQGTAPTFSILDLRAPAAPEADRISRFETDTSIRPIATDSTIAIEWGVAVNDQLALDPNVAPNLGDQKSGDLSLRYDFIAITVRRRSRFGADRSWKPLEERIELPADFSDPSGVSLTGSFAQGVLTKFWDKDVQVAGKQAAKKLLINGSTPFDFKTKNPEVDEETVRDNPHWPCCDQRKPRYKTHEVIFRNESLGAEIAAPRLFTKSQSRLSFLRPAYARPQQFGTAIPPGALVAHVSSQFPGVIFRAELDEDAAFCFVRLAWRIARGGLALVAFDGVGKVVGGKTLPLGGGGDFQNVMIAGPGPIRRLEARLIFNPETVFGVAAFAAAQTNFGVAIEVDRVAYVGLRSYLDAVLALGTCAGKGDDFENGYEGKGKLFFLPNHDYEIGVTTRVAIEHPSKPAESSEVKEYVYFKTKGLPGLNAVERTGGEIEPYVNAAYTGGRGALYRDRRGLDRGTPRIRRDRRSPDLEGRTELVGDRQLEDGERRSDADEAGRLNATLFRSDSRADGL